MTNFQCHACNEHKPRQTEGGTGYATDNANNKICYECCGKRDRADMIATGKATLYLTMPGNDPDVGVRSGKDIRAGKVSNWPGTLSIPVHSGAIRKGRHNIAGNRYDVHFVFDGYVWHGVQYGDNTQIVHCKRTKEIAR